MKYNNEIVYCDPDSLESSPNRQVIFSKCSNPIRLDSKFEFQVYLYLRKHFDKSEILIHHPVEVRPATENFQPRYWKVDFKCSKTIQGVLRCWHIEAKGKIQTDFLLNLMMLEMHNPALFNNLWIVAERNKFIQKSGVRIYKLGSSAFDHLFKESK